MHAVSYMHNMHSIGMILLNGTTIVTIMLTKLLNEIAFRIYQNIIQIKITLSIYMSCIHLFFSFIWVSRKMNKGFTFHFHMPHSVRNAINDVQTVFLVRYCMQTEKRTICFPLSHRLDCGIQKRVVCYLSYLLLNTVCEN